MSFNVYPMYTWVSSGAITNANDAFLNLLGFMREEVKLRGASTGGKQTPTEYLPERGSPGSLWN
jgi:hypothetical protein